MEEEPPSCPGVASEESGSSQRRTPPAEPYEDEVQVLSDDADWLPVYKEEKEAVDCIKAYTSDVHVEKDLDQKMQFLNSILTLCSAAAGTGLTEGLDVFCSTNSLAENIRVLLLEEPTQQLSTSLRIQSMNAIADLSKMKAITGDEISHLLHTCFKVVFYLPPEEDLSISLYNHTLHAMDEMLQIVVANYPTPSVTEELHGILEVLLPFTSSVTKVVYDRAMVRMWRLCGFLDSSHWGKSFAERLVPSQRTDFVLMTLERTIRDSSTEDKERSEIILDAVLTEPGIWLTDVPQILGFIHRNLGSISTSLQQILFSVLDALSNQFPRDALMSVLTKLPQSDSATLDIWKLMLHLPDPARILEELRNVLRDQQLCGIFKITTAELGLLHLTVMPPTEETLKELWKPAVLQNILKMESLPILWLGLRGLLLLSERREMAREIRALLPNITETMSTGNTHVTLEALQIFKNVISHVQKREASSIALTLAEKILPLFNHVSSEVRESSIRLFRDLMEAVVWCQKGNMTKKVRGGLLPLLLRMSDENLSVAQAAGETLVTCAKFLRWKKLKRLAKEQNTLRIRDCLLYESRKRVEGYLRQSLPYLKDSQASVRFEAVRFIRLAVCHSREEREEMLNEIYSALHPLEYDDHLAVRSLATGIILMMKPKKPPAIIRDWSLELIVQLAP